MKRVSDWKQDILKLRIALDDGGLRSRQQASTMTMSARTGMRNRLALLTALGLTCWMGFRQAAEGCAVPVFRYALERWQPYAYEAVVFHKEPLTEDAKKALEGLKQTRANMAVWTVSAGEKIPDELVKLWESQRPPELPWLVIRYPYPFWQTIRENVVWAGKFDPEVIRRAIYSPGREKIAKDILSGVSCVWAFIESGNKSLDDEKRQLLEDTLAQIKKETKLPPEALKEVAQGAMAGIVPLKVDFTVVSLSRNNPQERIFVDMLLKTEPDYKKHAEKPMAFPIFGQGRAMWALIGDGINKDMIAKACQFLLGFCSCEVKDLNPGVDMLMNVNWYGSVTNLYTVPSAPPELMGLSAIAEQQKKLEASARVSDAATQAIEEPSLKPVPVRPPPVTPGKSNRVRVLIAVGAVIAIVGATGAWLNRNKEE